MRLLLCLDSLQSQDDSLHAQALLDNHQVREDSPASHTAFLLPQNDVAGSHGA
jgi:hypothetical protein